MGSDALLRGLPAEPAGALLVRCQAAVEARNVALAWGLDAATIQAYAAAISECAADGADDDDLQLIAMHYHADHQHVAALYDAHRLDHADAWRHLVDQVITILRREGLGWSSDSAVAGEDLAQLACLELARALPGYRYQSRFTAWAYKVVVLRIRRYLRDSRREKRAARPDSLDQLGEYEAPAYPAESTETDVHARLLYELIQRILAEQPDRRLSTIFHLWAIEDRRTAEIGSLLGLHASRVRALLRQIRDLLHNDPAFQGWDSAGS